jgi:hypothetical protein
MLFANGVSLTQQTVTIRLVIKFVPRQKELKVHFSVDKI